MQTITITGRVGGNAETRQAGNGTVTNFSCAVEQGWGQNKITNWFRVAIWGERGTKLQPYIKKGEKVAVTGDLLIGEYNGKPQYEVRAADIDCFMTPKGDGGSTAGASSQGARHEQPAAFGPDLDDEVPF
jgi:single-strand DNA-binding protein